MQPDDFEICLGQRRVRGLRWNTGAPVPTLALHGWLDNAGSFAAMAEYLQQIKMQAIDLAGQGHSDPRGEDGSYDLPGEMRDMHRIVTALSPDQPVNLLGHSRGAVICTLYAALFPQRVKRLMMIDAVEPFRSSLAELPESLAASIEQLESYGRRDASFYKTREEAIQARINALTPVSRQGAEHLAHRALVETDKGWCWQADQRLKGTSGFRLTEEMRQLFYSRVKAPALLLEPLHGMMHKESRFSGAGEFIPGLQRMPVPGGHHCHLDDCPQQVAQIAEKWFGEGKV